MKNLRLVFASLACVILISSVALVEASRYELPNLIRKITDNSAKAGRSGQAGVANIKLIVGVPDAPRYMLVVGMVGWWGSFGQSG